MRCRPAYTLGGRDTTERAVGAGVEVFPGFAASEFVYSDDGKQVGAGDRLLSISLACWATGARYRHGRCRHRQGAQTQRAPRRAHDDCSGAQDGQPKDTFARGMELRAKQTILAEVRRPLHWAPRHDIVCLGARVTGLPRFS